MDMTAISPLPIGDRVCVPSGARPPGAGMAIQGSEVEPKEFQEQIAAAPEKEELTTNEPTAPSIKPDFPVAAQAAFPIPLHALLAAGGLTHDSAPAQPDVELAGGASAAIVAGEFVPGAPIRLQSPNSAPLNAAPFGSTVLAGPAVGVPIPSGAEATVLAPTLGPTDPEQNLGGPFVGASANDPFEGTGLAGWVPAAENETLASTHVPPKLPPIAIQPAIDTYDPKELEQLYAALKGDGGNVKPDPLAATKPPVRMPPIARQPAVDTLTPAEIKEIEALIAAGQIGSTNDPAPPVRFPPISMQPPIDLFDPTQVEGDPLGFDGVQLAVPPKADPGPKAALGEIAPATVAPINLGAPAAGPKAPAATSQFAAAVAEAGDWMGELGHELDADDAAVQAPKNDPTLPIGIASDLRSKPTVSMRAPADRDLSIRETGMLLGQVADRIESLAAARPRNGVTIQLQPHDLGHITLLVKNRGNEVEAQIVASHEGVRQALESGRAQLGASLESRGLTLANVTVSDQNLPNSHGGGFGDAQARQAAHSLAGSRWQGRISDDAGAVDALAASRWTPKSDGVDLWI